MPARRFGSLVVDPTPLRLDRDFRLLWTGQAISVVGRMVTTVVLPTQVYLLTGDLLALGALSLVQLVPILVFSLGGGAVADAVVPDYVVGLENIGDYPNIVRWLVRHGYSDDEIARAIGGNTLRVLDQAWAS